MIGVLLTSTCYYEGIDSQTFSDRVEELVQCIVSVKEHIRSPYELIIADNSPKDRVPTEQLLAFCPEKTIFLRSTHNPGKDTGEAMLIRDGIYLSCARGHRWTFKLTGRYFINGDWTIDSGVDMLEKSGKKILARLIGKRMRELGIAAGHPLMRQNMDSDRLLGGIASQAFIADPTYLVQSGALKKDYLYREMPWVNFEQSFRHALDGLELLHWPSLPIGGFAGNKSLGIPIQLLINASGNPAYETVRDYRDLPIVDISPLLGTTTR